MGVAMLTPVDPSYWFLQVRRTSTRPFERDRFGNVAAERTGTASVVGPLADASPGTATGPAGQPAAIEVPSAPPSNVPGAFTLITSWPVHRLWNVSRYSKFVRPP